MGHSGTAVTELVYRHELRPVLQAGASVMDAVFAHVRARALMPAKGLSTSGKSAIRGQV